MQSKKEMPLEHKPILTIREASFYTGISEKKLIEITNLYACPFVLWMGNRRFIKRKAFEKFIQTSEFKGGMNRLNDGWFSSKSESVPLWHKIALSIDEMYVYTGIGRETIRELTKQPEAKQFTLKIGKRTLIKRKQFEEYLDQMCSI